MGPVLAAIPEQEIASSKWLRILQQIHDKCHSDSQVREMITSEVKEMNRLRDDCYMVVAKIIKS